VRFVYCCEGALTCARRRHVLRHYDQITLVAMDLRRFVKRLRTEKHSKTLFVTHSSRLDIVLGFVSHARVHEGLWGEPFRCVGLNVPQCDVR